MAFRLRVVTSWVRKAEIYMFPFQHVKGDPIDMVAHRQTDPIIDDRAEILSAQTASRLTSAVFPRPGASFGGAREGFRDRGRRDPSGQGASEVFRHQSPP